MPKINSIKYGEIQIDKKTYYSDMLLFWDGKKALLEKTHIIDLNLLEKILKKRPDSIVIGVGLEGTVKLGPGIREVLKKAKVKLFIDKTLNAMEIYNALQAQGKRVAAIIHATL